MLERTKTLIEDVSNISSAINNVSPNFTGEYLVKIALIYFNLDVETALKGWLNNNNSLITIISKFNNNIRDFCNFYNTNFNNPNIEKLNAICQKFGLCSPKLDYSEVTIYNNIIKARNEVSHDPYSRLNVSLEEIKTALETAEKILKFLEKQRIQKKKSKPC